MNGYELSRKFFDWSFENPQKINPNHIALYFFCIEHCNRLGWKSKFGLPTTMAKEAIGIRSYNTYINTLNQLVEFGFIEMIEKSKNQYSSNIIALSNFNKTLNKALDKALIKHGTKQSESTRQSNSSIDKQETINNEQLYIDCLNSILNKTFKLNKTREKEIKKIIKEGYTIEQAKNVVKLKLKQWGNDEKMSAYLTPDTLFRFSKFEGYVEELSNIPNTVKPKPLLGAPNMNNWHV